MRRAGELIPITTTIGHALAGLIAAGIVVIGARFVVAPRVAAAGYGVAADSGAYLSAKGVRDIASGLIVVVLLLADATHLLGWVMLAATIIPVADSAIVLRNGGSRTVALGVHGVTAAVMLVTAGLLLSS